MPLGLLKSTVTWFSSHLSEDESKSILCSIKQGGLVVNKSLSSLLYEWVRIGYSGKTSIEKFRLELHAAYENRCSFLSEQIKKGVSTSSSAFNSNSMYDTSYSSGIKFHAFFPQKLNMSTHLSTYPTNNNTESRPVDHIIFFHKALKKDMEQVVSMSANLAVNHDLFKHFFWRFHHIRVLHKIYTDALNEIAFPALEAKELIQNSGHSYSNDHKMDAEYFNRISYGLDQVSELYYSGSSQDMLMYRQLCAKLHSMCKGMKRMLSDHMAHEEIDLWPLFTEHLSLDEQEKIIGCMLGRTRAETLQEMIPWIMASLTVEEQNSVMSLWRKATKNTMFDQWLSEWWEGMKRYDVEEAEKSTVSTQSTLNTLEIVLKYLPREHSDCENRETSHKINAPEELDSELALSQEELEAIIIRVSRDDDLEPQQKSMIIQDLMMSRWIKTQKKSDPGVDGLAFQDFDPSYHDCHKLVFGCEHYKRNCKLLATCCNKLYTCRHCHDENTDHVMDRKATTMMMCMKCLIIQPIGPTCSTVSCNNLSMARYYCRICKLFDDERKIYHCPYCNLCRVGEGLGMDYSHCMTCNACMAKSLTVHICREKCLEDNCPICHEYIFTSNTLVKTLACGHVMHSSCFEGRQD